MLREKTSRSLFEIGDLAFGLDAELIDPIAIFPGSPTTGTILAGASFRQRVTADRAAEELILPWDRRAAMGNGTRENAGGELCPGTGGLKSAV